MRTLLKNISSLCTLAVGNPLYRKGKEMQNIGELNGVSVIVRDGLVERIGNSIEIFKYAVDNHLEIDIIDCTGKTVIPGFCDSHTHIVFAGNRADEFAMRLAGASYQEIAERGGGIQATMKATRDATTKELMENGRKLGLSALKHGTTSMEIKSGYALELDGEIRQLRAIRQLQKLLPITLRSTFLGAHDFPPEYKNDREGYISLIIDEILPLVARERLADYCDAFIDEGYFTTSEAARIFKKAQSLGMKIRTHSDELADVGAAGFSADIGAVSADHLLKISDEGIAKLANSKTVATLLPGTAYFLQIPYAPARKIIDNGCVVALATDCNPGSCMTENMQIIMSLAVMNMKMTCEEALTAATINGAYAMGLSEITGSIAVGKKADLLICDCPNYRDIFYHFGWNFVEQVMNSKN